MARKPNAREPTPEAESQTSGDEVLADPPISIEPYAILSIEKTATSDQIKSAYRKAALKHHPDKASAEDKDKAHKKFQEIAFAYAILSDEKRRKRYDTTGSTAETMQDDEDFDWVDFFREQTAAMVDGDMIEKIKKEYQGSEEEKQDVLNVYSGNEGDMDALYEHIMCSNVLEDDARFRNIIDETIAEGKVEAFDLYAKEDKTSKRKRVKKAKAEESEAMELAEQLGVKDRLFAKGGTGGKTGTKSKSGPNEDALKALIQQRQQGRAEGFFDQLEAKYGGSGLKKGKRKGVDEPPEEMFQKNAKKARGKRA